MTMGEKYKAVFFDADDTLFDYPRAERAAVRACLREFRIRIGLEACLDAYRRHNGEVWRAFERGETDQATLRVERFRRLAAELRLADLPVERVSVFYLEALAGQPQLYPGALGTVRALARTFPLALVTNGIALVQRKRFAASPITRYFRSVVISEEAGVAKPDPRIFAPALEAIGVAARDVLFVGDSVTSDMAAARNAGMDFCWVNPAGSPLPPGQAARFVIADIQALPGLLRGARARQSEMP
jgi:YjjG family noncanonical pyrimidine nucleotidase